MMDIEWILFSKDRTLQAKSCILSFTAISDVTAGDITMLYVDSAEISYEPLKKEFPCRFVKQTNNFYEDIVGILRNTSKPFVSFMVDDLIFRDCFTAAEITALMQKYHDLDSFSLRLGKNIKDGHPPEFEKIGNKILSWKTTPGLGTSWNYFWELTGAIYRREMVLDYMKKCPADKVTFPNPLEFLYYDIIPNVFASSRGVLRTLKHPKYLLWKLFRQSEMSKRIACYEKSRAFTQGVNMVASMGVDYDTYIAPQKMHKLFLEGYRIDFECLKDVHNIKPNAGRQYFRLVGPGGEIHSLSVF